METNLPWDDPHKKDAVAPNLLCEYVKGFSAIKARFLTDPSTFPGAGSEDTIPYE
jgi:hypothetical protein